MKNKALKAITIILCLMLTLQFVGCGNTEIDATNKPTQQPSQGAQESEKPQDTEEPEVSPTVTTEPTATATKKPTATATKKPTATATKKPTATATKKPTATPTKEAVNFVQQPDVRDWSYLWWKNGYKASSGAQLNILTGYYGMAISPITGKISYLGAIGKEMSWENASAQDHTSTIEALAVINKMDYSITLDGVKKKFKSIEPLSDPNYGTQAKSRIIESGRYMQCVDIMNLTFQGETDVTGRLEIAAMPKYLSAQFAIWSREGKSKSADLEYSFTLGSVYTKFEKSSDGKAITAIQDNGSGITFVLPNIANASLALNQNTRSIVIKATGITVKKMDFVGVNVIIIPSTKASINDAKEYTQNSKVTTTAVQIAPKAGKKQAVEFDNKGFINISLNGMVSYQGPDFRKEDRLDDMDRLTFTLKNDSNTAVKVPVQFHKEGAFGYLGCSPFLRDAKTGEPIGVQVQLSKNWHSAVDFDPKDPATYLDGQWFRGTTYLEVPANSSVTYEFTMTYAMWGGAFAASHSQLCLVGWGGGYQQWESSAIGCFGESFCYEAEMTHGRGMITDIRPLLVNSFMDGGKYNWTENIGGGNFLVYTKTSGGEMQGFKQVRTQFRKQGPNLTEVIYRGYSADGKIEYEYTVNLPRTNDVSRAYHSFKYKFLQDVSFDRLAFYQMGGDNYNDNHWDTMAVGNENGTVSVNMGGTTYSGDFALPTMSRVGYVGGSMQCIDVPGKDLWVAFMGYEPVLWKKEPGANRMMHVMSYNATINGKKYSKPSLSFYHTLNGGVSCIAVELSPPAEAGKTIKAGSVVEGTIEWLNIPEAKADYYGPSAVIKNMNASDFNTSKVAYAYAKGAKYTVTATKGTVTKTAPIYVKCEGTQAAGTAVAQITITGGMGYVPITFTGVKSYSGYSLEIKNGSKWEKVDQSVNGNDYWQAWCDASTGTYELTYNVEHTKGASASYTYRLVKNK